MTICPIAIVSGCKKCPLYKVCPLKGVIGDAQKDDAKDQVTPVKDDRDDSAS